MSEMTVAEAVEIAGIEALRDDSIHPPQLQFGDPKHIAARDLMRLKSDIDALDSGGYFYGSTIGELVELHEQLMERERAA